MQNGLKELNCFHRSKFEPRKHFLQRVDEQSSNELKSSEPKELLYAKESPNLTKLTVEKMNDEISALVPTDVKVGDTDVSVKSEMIFSMVDTKVVNDITGTSSQKCFRCLRSGKSLNDAVPPSETQDSDICAQVFSPLHAKIRTMELLLNVSYKMTLEKPAWRVSKGNKVVRDRQETIRLDLRQELGLRISEPLPSGGNTNDGNSSDTFFENIEAVARITGLDLNLLERFRVLLVVLNSKEAIDPEAYYVYAEETRRLYVGLYGWYPLSPTVHKMLVHGADIIKNSLLPVGMLSEEAQETRNKSIRNYREHHARKIDRAANLEDVFKRLMFTSDPKISLLNRDGRTRAPLNLPDSAKHLLIDR